MDIEQSSIDFSDIEKAFGSLSLNQGDNSQASNALIILAEASKWDQSTREQLAHLNILETLLEIVECSVNDSLETVEVALRCIGNACIDNENAKAEITKRGFSWAKSCLPTINDNAGYNGNFQGPTDSRTAMLTGKVLYNVCSDYEPAQQKCFEERVHYAVIKLLKFDEVVRSEDRTLSIELLFWICSHVVPDQSQPSLGVLRTLLSLPSIYQPFVENEDFALLAETCLLFLREDAVKSDVLSEKLVESVWWILQFNEARLAKLETSEDDKRILRPLSTGLIWILSDLAAMPQFAAVYSLNDDLFRDVLFIIEAVEQPYRPADRLVDASCQLLGNLLWSAKAIVDESLVDRLQQPVLRLLKTSEDAELLHSAAGLLIQLLRASPALGEAVGANRYTGEVIERLCRHAMPQIKQDGIAILRLLGKDSAANRERFADLANEVMALAGSNDVMMVEA